ncbi:MAG: Bug family tripartite tricarboxylate transporter substrate binding protein [Syntrophales bacterium]
MKRTISVYVVCAVIFVALSSMPASAQNYPTHPIRFIVAQQPGSQNDVVARLIAPRLAEVLGQPVVIDNRPGAGGAIGFEILAQTPPDGYTLAMGSISTLGVIPMLPKKPHYDVFRDFQPVTLVSKSPYIMVVNPAVPAKSLKEFVALAKARPGTLNYASSGNGTGVHLTSEMFKLATGINMTHVPYKSAGPATVALLSGEVEVMLNNMIPAIPHIRSGKLRALAVTGSQRSSVAPQVPTVSESGYPDFESTSWQGVVVRAGSPPEIVARLNREIVKILNKPEVKSAIENDGNDVIANSPQEFMAFIRTESKKLAEVIRIAHVE